jgi:hypothetical protein
MNDPNENICPPVSMFANIVRARIQFTANSDLPMAKRLAAQVLRLSESGVSNPTSEEQEYFRSVLSKPGPSPVEFVRIGHAYEELLELARNGAKRPAAYLEECLQNIAFMRDMTTNLMNPSFYPVSQDTHTERELAVYDAGSVILSGLRALERLLREQLADIRKAMSGDNDGPGEGERPPADPSVS